MGTSDLSALAQEQQRRTNDVATPGDILQSYSTQTKGIIQLGRGKTKKNKGGSAPKKPAVTPKQNITKERMQTLTTLKTKWAAKPLAQTTIDQLCVIEGQPIIETNVGEADFEEIEENLENAYREQMTPDLSAWQQFFSTTAASFRPAGVSSTGYQMHISIYPDAFSQPKCMLDHEDDEILGQLLASTDDQLRLHASLEYPNMYAPNKPRLYYGEKKARGAAYPPPAGQTQATVRQELDTALATYVEDLRSMIQKARNRGGLIP